MTMPVRDTTVTTDFVESGGSISLSEPGSSGTSVGDVVVIMAAGDWNNATSDVFDDTTYKPTGFTLIHYAGLDIGDNNQDCQAAAWYRVIDGTESWPITVPSNNGNRMAGCAIRFTDVDTSNVVNVVGTPFEDNVGFVSPMTIDGVTTTQDDCYAMYMCVSDGDDCFPHSLGGLFTKIGEVATSTSGAFGIGLSYGYQEMATADATGDVTVTFTVNDGGAGFVFALQGASASTPTVDDINTDEIVESGETGFTFTTSNFGSEINSIQIISGTDAMSASNISSSGGAGTADAPDITDITDLTAGIPFGSVAFRCGDGTDTADLVGTFNPNTGYSRTVVASINTAEGSLAENFDLDPELPDTPPDGSQFLFEQGSGDGQLISVSANGIFTTNSATDVPFWFGFDDSGTWKWKQLAVLLSASLGTATLTDKGNIAINIGIQL